VAQTYSGKVKHMTETLVAAEQHDGFSFVNIRSPCVTFNQVDTFATYRGKIAITEEEAKQEMCQAYTAIAMAGDKVPLGIFFQVKRPTLDGSFHEMAKAAAEKFGVPTMEEIVESFA
jgi:2-oxoglutarate ferredoxin oxidoreductase subunit beta